MSAKNINKRILNSNTLLESKQRDFTNKKINHLTIIEILKIPGKRRTMCYAKCDCNDNIKLYQLDGIVNGHSRSCGCYRSKKWIERNTKHGLSRHPLSVIWTNIKARCRNKKNPGFKWYGLIGIEICNEWANDFKTFYDWCIANGWERGLEIDRYPNKKGNYCPENCRITTHQNNMNNIERNRILIINGTEVTMAQASVILGIKYCTLERRMRVGWSNDEIVNTPVQFRKPRINKTLIDPLLFV
jgi:hypothetical protein